MSKEFPDLVKALPTFEGPFDFADWRLLLGAYGATLRPLQIPQAIK